MPSERDFHASVLHENFFYIIGGSDKSCKLNEIHRIKIKDEEPSRTIHKDLKKLLNYIYEEHLFSDLHINVTNANDEVSYTLYTYYPLVKLRAPLLIENATVEESKTHELQIYKTNLAIMSENSKTVMKYVFEYIYTDWIDFINFENNWSFDLLKAWIKYRLTRLFKITARYIAIGLNFANAWEYLNNVTNIEQDYDIGDVKSKDLEWKALSIAFDTLKKIILKFITTHHKKFQSMEQYKDLNPYSVLSIDGFWAVNKLNSTNKKKSPYEGPDSSNSKSKVKQQVIVNTNYLHVERIPKADKFVSDLKEIYSLKTSKNFVFNWISTSGKCTEIKLDMFILAGRSGYFEFMLLSNMTEALSLSITVDLPKNISPDLFKIFTKYLYYDDKALPDELDIDESLYLFECAEFYQIQNAERLKVLCEKRVKGIGKNDPVEVADKAQLLGAKKIKSAATKNMK